MPTRPPPPGTDAPLSIPPVLNPLSSSPPRANPSEDVAVDASDAEIDFDDPEIVEALAAETDGLEVLQPEEGGSDLEVVDADAVPDVDPESVQAVSAPPSTTPPVQPPPPPSNPIGTEIPRPVGHIPDKEFKRAGGATRSTPPPASKAGASTLTSIQIVIALQDALGITFPQETPPKTAVALKRLLIERIWPESEEQRLELMRLTLQSLNPATFAPGGSWSKGTHKQMLELFLSELNKRGRLRALPGPLRTAVERIQLAHRNKK